MTENIVDILIVGGAAIVGAIIGGALALIVDRYVMKPLAKRLFNRN